MAAFEVHIMETSRSIELPVEPNDPTPEIRDVITTVDARDDDAAKESAWLVWDAKYGPGQRPESCRIEIKPL